MSPAQDHLLPAESPRRGRPPGSVSLDEEKAWKIVNLIRSGVFDYVAAEAVGVSDRTFRDWMARGEGTHETRSSTPKLRKFAEDVRSARAEARAAAENKVYSERPAYWLSRAARSKPSREGWTEIDPEQQEDEPTLEERIAELDRQGGVEGLIHALEMGETLRERVAAREIRGALEAAAQCPDPDCQCAHNKRKDPP
jgi:hypothetical protein